MMKKTKDIKTVKKEPFQINFNHEEIEEVQIRLTLQGHYGEPDQKVDINIQELQSNGNLLTYLMVFNPFQGEWEFCVSI